MEAVEAGEDALERARFSGNPRMLLWALSALSTARLAEGDVSAALRHAGEAAALEVRPDVHAAGQPGWALGAALTAAGNADQAVAAMLGSFGGAELPDVMPGERPAAAADLVAAQLARGDVAARRPRSPRARPRRREPARRGRRPSRAWPARPCCWPGRGGGGGGRRR